MSHLVPVSFLQVGAHRVKSSSPTGQQVGVVILLHQLYVVGTLRLQRWERETEGRRERVSEGERERERVCMYVSEREIP